MPPLFSLAARVWSRLSGREAAALRYQRDAHAEEAGRERQKHIAAERETGDALRAAAAWERDYETAVALLRALCAAVVRGDPTHELAAAKEWLRDKPTELEGSRAGLAWMPGEATADDETLESAGEGR